jgi:uncharacterized membrane protein YjjB (DUF3815 family)
MTNAGTVVIGGLMLVIGLIAGYVNSYLILQHINATSTMWALWWGSMILVIFGSIVAKLGE